MQISYNKSDNEENVEPKISIFDNNFKENEEIIDQIKISSRLNTNQLDKTNNQAVIVDSKILKIEEESSKLSNKIKNVYKPKIISFNVKGVNKNLKENYAI